MATLGGGINSFLENFAETDREVPKLALYRLWLGPDPDRMKCHTRLVGRRHLGPVARRLLPCRGQRRETRGSLCLDQSPVRQGDTGPSGGQAETHLRASRAGLREDGHEEHDRLPHVPAVKHAVADRSPDSPISDRSARMTRGNH